SLQVSALRLGQEVRDQEFEGVDLLGLPPLLGLDLLKLKLPTTRQLCTSNDGGQPGQKGEEEEDEAGGIETGFLREQVKEQREERSSGNGSLGDKRRGL